MKLYLNEYPRAFILVSDQYALIVRHPYPRYKYHHHHLHHHHHQEPTSDSAKSKSSKVIVEFVRKDSLNLSKYVDLTIAKGRAQNLSGFLGLLNVKDKLYLVFVSSAVTVATPRVDEDVQKITGVEIFCLNSDEFDWQFLKLFHTPVSSGLEDDYFELQSTDEKLLLAEGPVPSVRKLLSLGSFFFSHQFDVTSTIQERGFRDMQLPKFSLMGDLPYQRQFMWNAFLVSELIEFRGRLTPYEQICFDSSGFLVTITRGYAKTVNSTLGNGEEVLLTLISKQACAKNGPLFGDWGSDDNGHVSNFVESELVLFGSKFCLTYIMVRGNVPILWSLETHISKRTLAAKKNKKVVFPRSFEASQVAFTKHLDLLSNQYGDIHILNSLSQDTKTYKGKLNITFKEHINYFLEHRGNDPQTATNYKLGYTDMPVATSSMKKADYTAVNPHEYSQSIAKLVLNFGALFYDIDSRTYVGKQLGVFRVNSFDSLSKASFLCKIISQEVIELAMRDLGIDAGHDLLSKHARLWAETDEYLRNITINFVSYTDKLHSSSAASKGIVPSQLKKRYLHTVLDHKPGEMAILKLLGALQDQVSVSLHNPLHDYVTKELDRREKEFTSQRDILVFASTFNVNASCEDQDKFKSWLFPPGSSGDYDLVFIGLQEIVELTASQMVDTDSLRRQMWEMHLRVCLEANNTTQSRYILLWSGQLGGIALFLFVKQLELKEIHDVEGSFKKTGFGGVSANKGAVAVRFNYSNTGLCLVASHFAAGHGNTIERHQNFKTIGKGIKFSKNRRIKDHDAVIWLGDFNYRINLPLEQVHALVEKKDFPRLFEYDQLNQQMASGESFPYFDEMELRFKPTYKFDNGTSTYDTSEKQRIPAWTDRILSLSRKKIIKQHLYDCSDEIKFSDHRPVYATLTVSISVVNETVKKNLTHELYENYRKNYGDINDMIVTNTNLSFLISEADDKVLPPPSSDTTKWWLSNGMLAKITIPELSGPNADQFVFNPKYPHNPFLETEEPEFILRSQLAQ